MSKQSKANLQTDDRKSAFESLRLLISGVPIKDEDGRVIGWIERPNLEAIKFAIENTSDD